MRIFHFILGKANKERPNGVNQVIAGLAKYSARLGADVRVIGMAGSVEVQGEVIQRDGFEVTAFSRASGGFFSALRAAIAWADVVHLHGVFSPWNLYVARMCRRLNRPYVVTLHNGLAPHLVAHGRARKILFHCFAQKRHLKRAAAIHVSTEEESTEALSWLRPRSIWCVPSGVDLDEFPRPQPQNGPPAGEVVVGYLGRLSPEKNLRALCQAVANLRPRQGVRLVLAGPSSTYLEQLLREFSQAGTSWVGAKYGADKTKFLRAIDLFVHPSLCDVFSIAAMEVLAVGTPLLITRTAKASYFFDRGAFFMCEPTSYGLERGLEAALARREAWPGVAARGRELVEKRLNWSAAAASLMEQYGRIVEESRR